MLSSEASGPLTLLTRSVDENIVAIVQSVLGKTLSAETKADGVMFVNTLPPPAELAEPIAQWAARCWVRRDGRLEIRLPQTGDRPVVSQIIHIIGAAFAIAAPAFNALESGSKVGGLLVYKVQPPATEMFCLTIETDQYFELDFKTSTFEDVAAPVLLYLQRQGGHPGEISDFVAPLQNEWKHFEDLFPSGDTRGLWT
jgi:hypothetical protein